jgi:hypothetical protein
MGWDGMGSYICLHTTKKKKKKKKRAMTSAMVAIAAPASQLFITNTLHESSGSSATLAQLRSKLGARSISIAIPIPNRGLGCGGVSAMMSRGGRNKGWHHEQLVRCKSPEVEKDEEEGFEVPANAPKIEGVEQLVGGGKRGVEKIFSNLNQATLKHEPGRFCCYMIRAIFVTGYLWESVRVASTCVIHVKFHTECMSHYEAGEYGACHFSRNGVQGLG